MSDTDFTAVATLLAQRALLLLGCLPDAFWVLTPQEAIALIDNTHKGQEDGPLSLDRRTIEELKERFPDG